MAYNTEIGGGLTYVTTTDNTSIETLIPELWSDMILDYLEQKLVIKSFAESDVKYYYLTLRSVIVWSM